MQEGITFATKLAQAGIRVTLIADAAMLSRIRATKIVLVGADSVSTSGLVNKMGTSMLALAAKSLKKDFYSACTTEKFLPARYQLPQEPAKPAKEITKKDVPNLAVSNYYFDITPLDWLTAVVTESGKLGPEELKQRLRQMKVHPALA